MCEGLQCHNYCEVEVLEALHHATAPFPFFHCAATFSEADCRMLQGLFVGNQAWQHRDEAFYQCFLRDATAEVAPTFKGAVVQKMREVTGLPLTDHVHLTAQRMDQGQSVGVHSDQPLLGYEIARLVVQLNPDWTSEKGGILELMAQQDGPAVHQIEPRMNHGFGFILHPHSFHAVTRVTATRRSVVFNFWHPANSPELARAVEDWMYGLDFGALPSSLESVAMEAESRWPEEATYTASLAAWVLHKWGFSSETVVTGYRVSLGSSVLEGLNEEECVAIELACWVAALRHGHFSLTGWTALRQRIPVGFSSVRLREALKYGLSSCSE